MVTMESLYRKLPSLFLMVPSLTPYDLPFPKMGFHMPPRYANGHISATGDPIHFMFGSIGYRVFRVGGSNGAIYGSNKSKMAATAMLEKIISSGDISATGHHFTFCSRWGFQRRRIYGAIFDSNKFKMAAAAILGNFEWPYLRNGSRSTYIASIARSSLR